MNVSEIRARVLEVRRLVDALEDEASEEDVSGIVVSGMLAEQLVRELGAGASAGVVRAGDGARRPDADVAVHVIAGEPNDGDRAYVKACDQGGVPVVLVQLWPQASWREPFVLSPFVVECEAGSGFPVASIAGRIAEAVADAQILAERVPALREPVSEDVVRGSVLRAGLMGLSGSRSEDESRRLAISLEQAQLVTRLRSAGPTRFDISGLQSAAGPAAGLLAAGYAFRGLARRTRRVLPTPVADALVAAAGTWALARVIRRLEDL